MPAHQQQPSGDVSRARLPILVTLVALVLIASVVSLVVVTNGSDDDGAAAAKQPASSSAAAPSTSASTSEARTSPVARNTPAPSKTASKSAPKAATSRSADSRKPITYTVKRGDNLTVIAAWFKLHGYGDLYERNKKVIGSDPDLIRPGQKITISTSGVRTG